LDTSKPRQHVYWHELRSPVGTLVTLLDVMSQGFAGEAPAELQDLLERAKRQADRLSGMLAAAHDLERLRWGTLAVRREPVDLAGALRAAATVVEPAAKTRAVALEVKASEPVQVAADPALLPRCLEGLLRGAIEASVRGGSVSVELARVEGLATVTARIAAPMDAAALAQAFTEESALGIRGGSGLGLYEVKLLVEAMGGSAGTRDGALSVGLPGKA